MIKDHNTRKLAVTPSHKRAMMRNMTRELFCMKKLQQQFPEQKKS